MIEAVLVLALGAAGGTLIIRALAPLLWQLHKPISCDLCMSWWCSLLAALALRGLPASWASLLQLGLHVVPAVPVSMLTLKLVRKLTPEN